MRYFFVHSYDYNEMMIITKMILVG